MLRAVKKQDARPFKVADNIIMMVVDRTSGKKANFNSKETLIEAFKEEKVNYKRSDNVNFINRLNKNNILRFY